MGSLVFSNAHWYLVLLGLALGAFVIVAGLKTLSRMWPHPPVLGPYGLRTYPGNLPPLAEFLDQIAAGTAWSEEFDKRLDTAKRHKTFDDELENVAIALAERYRDTLLGVPPRKRGRVKRKFGLEELQAELRAIAGDLRLAAK